MTTARQLQGTRSEGRETPGRGTLGAGMETSRGRGPARKGGKLSAKAIAGWARDLVGAAAEFFDGALDEVGELVAGQGTDELEGLRHGSEGPKVEELQSLLVSAGHLTAAAMATGPGTFGDQTLAAVESFQRSAGLEVTGVVDAETAAALRDAPSRSEDPAPEVDPGSDQEAAAPTGEVEPGNATQKAIRDAALKFPTGSSGPSVPSPGQWYVDTDGKDGARMREAIQLYDAWKTSDQGPEALPGVREEMIEALLGSGYGRSQGEDFCDRIAEVHGSGPLPTTDAETLDYLGVQRQCVEFANTVAIGAGGKYAGHAATTAPKAEARPGMGWSKKGHYMLITGVHTDADGNPTKFDVVDANGADGGWTNPDGERPWERKVRRKSGLDATAGDVKRHDAD